MNLVNILLIVLLTDSVQTRLWVDLHGSHGTAPLEICYLHYLPLLVDCVSLMFSRVISLNWNGCLPRCSLPSSVGSAWWRRWWPRAGWRSPRSLSLLPLQSLLQSSQLCGKLRHQHSCSPSHIVLSGAYVQVDTSSWAARPSPGSFFSHHPGPVYNIPLDAWPGARMACKSQASRSCVCSSCCSSVCAFIHWIYFVVDSTPLLCPVLQLYSRPGELSGLPGGPVLVHCSIPLHPVSRPRLLAPRTQHSAICRVEGDKFPHATASTVRILSLRWHLSSPSPSWCLLNGRSSLHCGGHPTTPAGLLHGVPYSHKTSSASRNYRRVRPGIVHSTVCCGQSVINWTLCSLQSYWIFFLSHWLLIYLMSINYLILLELFWFY